MAINLLPIIIMGGAVLLSGKKKKRTTKSIAPAKDDVEVFRGDSIPDVIVNPVGKKFAIVLDSYNLENKWRLAASPPDNSISVLSVYHKWDSIIYKATFNLEGKNAGEGSLVFHLRPVNGDVKEPPLEIVEIQTKIL